jgi:tripartite-type tricarboxylate transporter receptor subunit TctC
MKRGLLIVVAIMGPVFASLAGAQAPYPSKPVRLMLGFAPGSIQDVLVRLMGERMSTNIAQPVVIENRVGAGGRIAVEVVGKAPADGYTIVLGSAGTHVLAPYLVKGLTYDPVKDFTPLSLAIRPAIGVVINPALPAKTVGEFVAYAKANPGKIAFGSTGVASSLHLMGERMKLAAGIDMLHVPLTGGNDTLNALLGNHVQLAFVSPGQAGPHVAAGKLRLLAVGISQRFPPLPDVPTLSEVLPGYDPVSDWFGYFAPASLPAPLATRLTGELVKSINAPDVRSKLESTSLIVGSSGTELASTLKSDLQVYEKIIKAVGLPPQ